MEVVTLTTLLLCSVCIVHSFSKDTDLSYDRLYTLGIAAYEEERWFQCVSFMMRALEEQKHFSDTLYECRLQCKQKTQLNFTDDTVKEHESDFTNLLQVQQVIKNSQCVRKCKHKHFGVGPAGSVLKQVHEEFGILKPYDYLQICAYKTDDMKQAVAAAYTFFLANPNHTVMLDNIQYYRTLPGVLDKDFINLEQKKYQTHYIEGTLAYTVDDWRSVVKEMEAGLSQFYRAEERCRLECEGLLHTAEQPEDRVRDLLTAISESYTEMVRCQLGCEDKLGVIHGKPVPDYVADHYHYLQYAFFKLKNYESAAAAAESYLLFKPHDDVMLNNKLYYLKRGYGDSEFIPTDEAMHYAECRGVLRNMLKVVADTMSMDEEDQADEDLEKVRSFGDLRGNPGHHANNNRESHENPYIQHFARIGIKVFADSEALFGPDRFAADGFMRPEQCQELIYLVQAKYEGKEVKPTLQNVTVPEAVELLKKNRVSDISLRILLRSSEVGRFFMQHYLNISKVYLHSTKVICRDHKDPSPMKKNCYIQEDGSCSTWFPINEQTDYVAVIHLNNIMTGGEIYMANQKLDGQGMMVKPRCGRMVGFPAKVPHGVLPFPSGVRCAAVYTYTKNRSRDESAHSHAYRYLAKLEDSKMEEHSERLSNRKTVLKMLEDSGISFTMSDEELQGEERVVADEMLTSDECKVLKDLAEAGGLAGDGYERKLGRSSPHTENELFMGLTVDRAAENGALRGDGYGDKRYNILSSISPHTKHEMFEGLTVLRAAQLANLKAQDEASVLLYLDMSEKSRDLVEKVFNLESPLYFDFTHLVCRKSIEIDKEREDLSHPVHADNCILQEDESCVRQFPAYTQRDYSALLYLNDEFEGGDFFFAHANKSEQVSVRPKCGRLVGFNAGAYHGVKAVTKGIRCALAMWFTLDPNFREIAHIQARKMLADRKNDPDYVLPSSSPLFTVPGIPESLPAKQAHVIYFGPKTDAGTDKLESSDENNSADSGSESADNALKTEEESELLDSSKSLDLKTEYKSEVSETDSQTDSISESDSQTIPESDSRRNSDSSRSEGDSQRVDNDDSIIGGSDHEEL